MDWSFQLKLDLVSENISQKMKTSVHNLIQEYREKIKKWNLP